MIHNDHLGTPQKMTDASGVVKWSVDYKPFGAVNSTTNDVTNNLRYPGMYFDAETGLLYNMNRTYNKDLGRYNEADPIGLKGGLNLYRYANDNPIKFADPDGLKCKFNIHVAIGAGIAPIGGSIGWASAECDCVSGKKKTANYGVISFGLSVSYHIKGLSDLLPVDFSLDDSFTTNHTSPPGFLSYDQISGPSIAYGYCHGFGNVKANTTETGPNGVEVYPNGPCPKIGINIFEDLGVFLFKVKEKEECCKQ